MSRLLCVLSLSLLLALPAFAQDNPATLGQPLPPDPALLMQMQQDIMLRLQDTHRLLGFVNPNDTATTELLTARQEELTQQLRDVMQQIHAPPPPHQPSIIGMPPGVGRNAGVMPADMPNPAMPPGNMQPFAPNNGFPPSMAPAPMAPAWGNLPPMMVPQQHFHHSHGWGGPAPEARPARELTEMQQSIESLRKEVAELKATVRALETQIQLLNRNILLIDRVRENGN